MSLGRYTQPRGFLSTSSIAALWVIVCMRKHPVIGKCCCPQRLNPNPDQRWEIWCERYWYCSECIIDCIYNTQPNKIVGNISTTYVISIPWLHILNWASFQTQPQLDPAIPQWMSSVKLPFAKMIFLDGWLGQNGDTVGWSYWAKDLVMDWIWQDWDQFERLCIKWTITSWLKWPK